MEDERISLAHGNGGRFMRELIEDVFARNLVDSELDVQADAVPIAVDGGEVMITTDGFTVQPLEFPGGDIGSLAVHGTVNDLAVAGARPLYLTLNAFIEEGLEMETLDRIVASLARAARETGVKVSAGDTKVLKRARRDPIDEPYPRRRRHHHQPDRRRSRHGRDARAGGVRPARRPEVGCRMRLRAGGSVNAF
jgi:hydrogenase expression/formation protein HypE